LYDGNGTDVVSGGNGNDRFYVTVDDHADRFIGGAGDDSYYVRHNYSWSVWRPVMTSSEIEEDEDGGVDTIYSNYHDVHLGANIENAVITPPTYWWPSAPNRVIGNALNNVIQVGTSSGHDQEYIIDGGAGNDTLIGGSTRDTFVVDSLGDVIIDQAFGDSVDTVQANIDYSIEGREELENLRLTGSAIYGTGNNDHNVIEGHLVDAVNHLAGLGGDDTYFVTRKDIITEQAGGGADTVVIAGWDEQTTSSMWFSVSDYQNVENLRVNNLSTYGPNGSIVLRANLQGDAGDNLLTGNMYANEIRGGAGNDVIRGNHFLAESNSSTQVNEADTLYGEDGHDTIYAAIYGADVHGGRGDDVLHGTGGGTGYGSRSGSDNFFYGAGDGTDRIVSLNGNYDTDRVIFGEGIVATETAWSREGNNLVIQLATGANDRLIIEGYWRDDWENPGQTTLVKTIDEFVFADGTIRRGTLEQLQVDNDVPVAHYFTYGATLRVDEPFSLALPEGAFTDDGTLTYSLDGPEWLHIDPQTGTISGTPPIEAESVSFYIVATDQYGEWTSMYHSLPTVALLEGTAADDVLTGTTRGEELIGLGGNDRLVGGGGSDVLSGGAGDDTYVIDSDGATIIELAGEGFDTVESSVYSYTADKNIERIVLVEGASGYVARGNVGSQELVGNSLDNHLDGGGGADEMRGGAGNDIYQVDNTGDVVIELAGEGTDSVYATVSTTLSANVEDGYLDSEGNLSLTGNALANKLYGNEDGNVLDGGAGIDTLEGFSGGDTYHVDSNSDRVIEQQDGGIDTIVRSSGSQFQLANHVENLRLTSSGQATGNALDNVIEGSDLANTLLGLGGNDALHGRGGNDQLTGGAGNDQLVGGAGDDKYVFDASSGSDVINNADGGFDGVFFTNGITRERLSFSRAGDDLLITVDAGQTPAVRVLNHFLGGDAAIDYVQPDGGSYLTTAQINQIVAAGGTGGQYDQVIDGTAAGEQLVGSSGKDLIKGLAGDDELFGMGGNDTLQGGDGDDYLAGGNGGGTASGDDRLEGGAGADTLSGEEGVNTLIGGAGNDSYVYGGGQDTIDNIGGGYDGVFFNDSITAEDMTFARDGDDLVITVGGNTNAAVRVTDHFLGGDSAIDFVQPDGGNMLDTAAINALAGGGGGNPGGGGNEGNDADYPNVVTGTAAGEQLLGTSGRDLVRGLAGDDTLFGFGGDDKFEGGEGNDYLSGGNGSFSGSGNDILIGGNGGDTLVGEDGNDMLIGGAGDDDYYYSAASGSDTIDNVGGGVDWVFMNGIAGTRLSFHQDGDDLLIRVDASAALQVRVLKHFLGGEYAISYVQPGSGNAIPASQIPSRLTPLPQGIMAVMAGSSEPLRFNSMSDTDTPIATPSDGRVSQSTPSISATETAEMLSTSDAIVSIQEESLFSEPSELASWDWQQLLDLSDPQQLPEQGLAIANPPLVSRELLNLVNAIGSFGGQASDSTGFDTGDQLQQSPAWNGDWHHYDHHNATHVRYMVR
jgi:Ca2+-binding RTX toxin-like protein